MPARYVGQTEWIGQNALHACAGDCNGARQALQAVESRRWVGAPCAHGQRGGLLSGGSDGKHRGKALSWADLVRSRQGKSGGAWKKPKRRAVRWCKGNCG